MHYFASLIAYVVASKWSLRGVECKTLLQQLPSSSHLLSSRKECSKGPSKKASGSIKDGGDRDKSPKWDKPSKDKGKGKKDEALKKISCFLCNKPHCNAPNA